MYNRFKPFIFRGFILFLLLFFILSGLLINAKGASSDVVANIINSVSEQKLREYLLNLVDNDDIPGDDENQTRYSLYTGGALRGNAVEAEFIKNHFQSLGLETEFQNFTIGGIMTENIIGRIKGRRENEVYLLTSHMDSTAAMSGTNNPAPGADDNGSGTALVMEVARALKNSFLSFDYSIEFITFSGEEQGLLGSRLYTDRIPAGKVIKGVINVDMIGNGQTSDCVKFGYKPFNGGDVLSSKIVEINNNYGVGLTTSSIQTSVGRSDHAPFWAIGIPAIFGFECSFSPVYHSVLDTTNKINFSQLTKTAKVVAGALVELANAESLPLPNTPTPGGPTTTNSPGMPTTTPTITPVPPVPTSNLYNCHPDPKCSSGQKNLQLCPLVCTPQ